jgi:hypothetical protein
LVMEYYINREISPKRQYLLDRMLNANLTGAPKLDEPLLDEESSDPDVLINDTTRLTP